MTFLSAGCWMLETAAAAAANGISGGGGLSLPSLVVSFVEGLRRRLRCLAKDIAAAANIFFVVVGSSGLLGTAAGTLATGLRLRLRLGRWTAAAATSFTRGLGGRSGNMLGGIGGLRFAIGFFNMMAPSLSALPL
jgi:hypothetical protein